MNPVPLLFLNAGLLLVLFISIHRGMWQARRAHELQEALAACRKLLTAAENRLWEAQRSHLPPPPPARPLPEHYDV